MEEEHRGIALVIMGVIAVVAVIGLVMMFSTAKKSAGALTTNWAVDGSDFACTSPCTLWPSHAGFETQGVKGADEQMMADRSFLRNFVKVGPDIEFQYADGTWFRGECWCPTKGNPQFMPTEEYASLIKDQSSGKSSDSYRQPGIPVDKYTAGSDAEVSYPTPAYGVEPSVEADYYPLPPQFEERNP